MKGAYVIDIESDGLLADSLDFSSMPYRLKESSRLWCVVIRNLETDEVFIARKEEITKEWMESTLEGCKYLIAHNGIKFDFIYLWLYGVLDYRIGNLGEDDLLFGKPTKIIDSLLLSRLLSPDRYLGHGLEAWGDRLGNAKTDFRAACIEAGIIDAKAPKAAEFKVYSEIMVDYCVQDTNVNKDVFFELIKEMDGYKGWSQALKQESKLADLAIQRESFGFFFDKEAAIVCLNDLGEKMHTIEASILPLIPPKPRNKGELSAFTPPKNQLMKSGALTKNMRNFIERVEGELYEEEGRQYLIYKGNKFQIPFTEPIETEVTASLKDLDHIKMHLMDLGWVPTEWRERDLTKDSKKQSISFEKRVKALDKWFAETLDGKYKEARLEHFTGEPQDIYDFLYKKLRDDWPVRIPTSPTLRVGVEKELCPNLVKLAKEAPFAGDFALYLTYKHRRSSIAGGEIEDMDFDTEYPNKGYLSYYREEDGRVPTPAIEVGAASFRYRHVAIANLPRVKSVYGKEIRGLFGAKQGRVFFGFDFASLEARIEAHYIHKYKGGPEMGLELLAEKPNDIHTLTGIRNNIDRDSAKSLNYMVLYGAAPPKIAKSLGITLDAAKVLFEGYWDSVLPLKMLKDDMTQLWESNDKKFIYGLDGRKIKVRSPHSLLNYLFQSGGVICAKYVTIFIAEELSKRGLNMSPFIGEPDICSMIEYHDEADYEASPSLFKFATFDTEDEAKEFKKNWTGGKLSAIGHGKKWYICLPNVVSEAIEIAIERMQNLLGLEVPLGFEFMVGNNWAECH